MNKCTLSDTHKHKKLFNDIMEYVIPYVEGIREEEAMSMEYYYLIFEEKSPQLINLISILLEVPLPEKKALEYLYKVCNVYELYEHLSDNINCIYDVFKFGYVRHQMIYTIITLEHQVEEKVSPNIRNIIGNSDLNRYIMEYV